MQATWHRNLEHQGIEVSFDSKPLPDMISRLKSHGFRWSSRQKIWYAKESSYRLEFIKEIATQEDDASEAISYAEQMNRLRERGAARAEQLGARAERKEKESERFHQVGHNISDQIPLGQPVLVGHHSEQHHRRDIDRIDRLHHAGMAAQQEAESLQARSDGAQRRLHQLDDPGVILRRIERIEADRRMIQRRIDDTTKALQTGVDRYGTRIIPERYEQLLVFSQTMINDLDEKIVYWKGQIQEAEDSGIKVWGPDDFQPDDRICGEFGGATVKRVNKKSLSVVWDNPTFNMFDISKVTYSRIREKLPLKTQSAAANG